MMGVLEFRHVSYYYKKDRMLLDDLQETFERGKIYVILGPSGCGKTTALSLLGGGGWTCRNKERFFLTARTFRKRDWSITDAAAFLLFFKTITSSTI